jgi:hypothetical protein
MVPSYHVGKFLPKTKGFFLHDFTLIASVMGESVLGHGIGGKVIPAKMAGLTKKPVAGVSNNSPPLSPDLIATQIVMALKSKYIDATY